MISSSNAVWRFHLSYLYTCTFMYLKHIVAAGSIAFLLLHGHRNDFYFICSLKVSFELYTCAFNFLQALNKNVMK